MYLGIDLGTSGVKVVLVDSEQTVLDEQSMPLTANQPQDGFSEQDPESWWLAVEGALLSLKLRQSRAMYEVRGMGLSGQMHGATLLDSRDRVLRPAILWNDGRSMAQCAELERDVPKLREISGNIAMPGFTAPKVVWVKRHEPEIFGRLAKVLLPKDYIRLLLTGVYATDYSDAAGTLWLNVKDRRWSEEMLAATELNESFMPELFEGSESTATLLPEIAQRFGLSSNVVVAGGAGDNAAGAVGVGAVRAGDAFVSLGTSGVYFTVSDSYVAKPESAVHSFCHCLPGRYHQMAVILSAASCLSWVAELTGAASIEAFLAEIAASTSDSRVLFLPYLSGERTPLNNPDARGVFLGMDHATDRGMLGRAVLEGVAIALSEGQRVLVEAGAPIRDVAVIGGGAKSVLWTQILAAALGRELTVRDGAHLGPAFGAARLARLAVTGESPDGLCVAPPAQRRVEVVSELSEQMTEKRERSQRAVKALTGVMW